MLEECRKKLDRLPPEHGEVVKNMLRNCIVYSREKSTASDEDFILSVEDFVCCFEETSLEESLTRKSYN